MPSNAEPLSAQAKAAFEQLSCAAADLNAVSDEMGKNIGELDSSLKKLNLGVSAWVEIVGAENQNGEYWSRKLGYAKVDGQWGIALARVKGHYAFPEEESWEEWLFNDAPRRYRLEAIGKIPELLAKLGDTATETAKKTKEKLAEVQEVTEAVKLAAKKPKAPALSPFITEAKKK